MTLSSLAANSHQRWQAFAIGSTGAGRRRNYSLMELVHLHLLVDDDERRRS
jgi:hypothetical protein